MSETKPGGNASRAELLRKFIEAKSEIFEDQEYSFVLIKPDAVAREKVGKILERIEERGLALRALRMETISEDSARKYYAEHEHKPFYEDLVGYITAGPSILVVVSGVRAIEVLKTTLGKHNPADAEPGTIRGDMALFMDFNLINASDNSVSAARSIELFFPEQAKEFTPTRPQTS